jgi:hypothetical protein
LNEFDRQANVERDRIAKNGTILVLNIVATPQQGLEKWWNQ